MDTPPDRPTPLAPAPLPDDPAALLRRLGWDEGQRLQTRIYAHMPPARKMQIALEWRQMQIDMFRHQLQAQHPDLSPQEIQALLLRRLDWVREPRY